MIQFHLANAENNLTFDRTDTELYCQKMLNRALLDGCQIKITWPDKSTTIFNPQGTEE